MVGSSACLAEGELQPIREVPCRPSARLGHEQPKARRTEPDREVRRPSLAADQVGELVGDIVRGPAVGSPADLEQQNGRGPSVPRVTERFVAEGGGPPRAGIELIWGFWPIRRHLRLSGSAPGRCRPIQERHDPGRGPFVVVGVGEDETARSAGLCTGWDREVVS